MKKRLYTLLSFLGLLLGTEALYAQKQPTSYTPDRISFSTWEQVGPSKAPYQAPFEKIAGEKVYPWTTSNTGYAYLYKPKDPKAYPVYGDAGKLVIRTLEGKRNFIVKAPLISGSAFLGSFSKKDMIFNPHKATHFGLPIKKQPVAVKGRYAYTPGPIFWNKKQKEQSGVEDQGSILAVLFEATSKGHQLDGRTIFGHKSIVAKGEMRFTKNSSDALKASSYTPFTVNFTPLPGKTIDFQNRNYKMTIILSSSVDGGDFSGAVGSTLVIPYLEVVYK